MSDFQARHTYTYTHLASINIVAVLALHFKVFFKKRTSRIKWLRLSTNLTFFDGTFFQIHISSVTHSRERQIMRVRAVLLHKMWRVLMSLTIHMLIMPSNRSKLTHEILYASKDKAKFVVGTESFLFIHTCGEAIRFCIGRLGIVKLLVENGADVTAKDSNGRTPLDVAMKHGNQAVIDYLKKHQKHWSTQSISCSRMPIKPTLYIQFYASDDRGDLSPTIAKQKSTKMSIEFAQSPGAEFWTHIPLAICINKKNWTKTNLIPLSVYFFPMLSLIYLASYQH